MKNQLRFDTVKVTDFIIILDGYGIRLKVMITSACFCLTSHALICGVALNLQPQWGLFIYKKPHGDKCCRSRFLKHNAVLLTIYDSLTFSPALSASLRQHYAACKSELSLRLKASVPGLCLQANHLSKICSNMDSSTTKVLYSIFRMSNVMHLRPPISSHIRWCPLRLLFFIQFQPA